MSTLQSLRSASRDQKRRWGLGLVGTLLYLLLIVGGAAVVVIVGDPPMREFSGIRQRTALEFGIPALVWALGLLGVAVAAGNLPTYARLTLAGGSDTGAVGETDGRVVLAGTAETAGGTIQTPFGRAPALAYTTRVLANAEDDAATAGDSEENWQAVHVGEETTRLAVDDGSGPATVDPTDARLYLEDVTEQTVTAGQELPSHVRQYLRTEGVDVDDDAHLRFEERSLEPGEEAFAMGTADGGTVDASLLAEGDHAERIRSRVTFGAGLGVPAAVLGYLGMLFVSGVV